MFPWGRGSKLCLNCSAFLCYVEKHYSHFILHLMYFTEPRVSELLVTTFSGANTSAAWCSIVNNESIEHVYTMPFKGEWKSSLDFKCWNISECFQWNRRPFCLFIITPLQVKSFQVVRNLKLDIPSLKLSLLYLSPHVLYPQCCGRTVWGGRGKCK